jgi:hypothetical protein
VSSSPFSSRFHLPFAFRLEPFAIFLSPSSAISALPPE